MAAVVGRWRVHQEPDEAGDRARQVRELDRAAARRHRQQARRFRIREDRGLEHFQEKWGPVFRPKMRPCNNALLSAEAMVGATDQAVLIRPVRSWRRTSGHYWHQRGQYTARPCSCPWLPRIGPWSGTRNSPCLKCP